MRRWLMIFLVVSLVLLLLVPACGDNDKETPTQTTKPTVTATAVVTKTPSATPTKVSEGPVKIGAITSWSGPAALSGVAYADPVIKLVEWQVKQEGGILGGRELQVARYDNRASVAEVIAGCEKLVNDEKVSALVWGGSGSAESGAMTTWAEQHHVLNTRFATIENAEQTKYTLSGLTSVEEIMAGIVEFTKGLNPKKVAYLGTDMADFRMEAGLAKAALEPAGIATVYEQFAPMDTVDYSPYLTKIKFEKPDVLILLSGTNEFCIGIAKTITDLGGWGDIKVVSFSTAVSAIKQSGADGWYVQMTWLPGSNLPGAIKFEQDFKTVNGSAPTINHVYFYNSLWAAVATIKAAGTDDPTIVADTARSGKVEWDTPVGHALYTKDGNGYGGLKMTTFAHIESGALVAVQ